MDQGKRNKFFRGLPVRAVLIFGFMAGMVLSGSCIPRRYSVKLDAPGSHRSVRLKFNLKLDQQRQNGKILLKYDEKKAKILFFSPLNQVYFKLLVEGDSGILINSREKKYWLGKFTELIRDMWAIDLSFDDLKRLIRLGTVPGEKLKDAGLRLDLKKNRKTGEPERIILNSERARLELNVLSRQRRKGRIQFYWDTAGFSRAGIDQVLVYE